VSFVVVWDNSHACGTLSGGPYDTEEEATAAGENWLLEMLALETTPEAREEAEAAYSYEVVLSDDARYRALLTKNGIEQPLPERSITEARWIAAQDDWWVRIDGGWLWWDRRASAWKASQHGP